MSAIEELPNGQWVIANDTHISRWSREWGTIKCDPALFEIMTPWLNDIEVVWDIGAFIGDHTRFYLDLGKTVVAVEPNPLSFKCLSHNCPEATLLNVAASRVKGKLCFSQLDNAGASRITVDGSIKVTATPLDSLDLPPPGFVKIDAEGWEYDVIQGMSKTLEKYRPLMFIEINAEALKTNGHCADDIVELLKDLGYTKFQIYPQELEWTEPQFDILVS